MKKKTKVKSVSKKYPTRAADVPVTQSMLYSVRDELKGDIKSMDLKMESQFKEVDGRFVEVESRFQKIDSRFDEMESRFQKIDSRFDAMESRMDSRFEKFAAELHYVRLLVEEQNNKNNIVLDALNNLFARQERFDRWLDQNAF
jgi:predicted transcriptional regulator